MPSRKITVHLVGDSDSLERAFDRSQRKGDQFGKSMRSSAIPLKSFAKAGLAGAAVAGTALFTKTLISSVSAAKEAEVAEAGLRQSLKQSGISYRQNSKAIDEMIQKTSKLAGIDDEELSAVFANLVRSTGSVTKAQKGMAIAANIARARNIPLATSAKAVERAYKGSDLALRRVGIVVPKVTRAYDALKGQESALRDQLKGATDAEKKSIEAKIENIKQSYAAARASDAQASSQSAIAEAQRKFAGSAETYGKTAAGAQDKLAVAWENLQEKLGAKLLPALTKVMLRLVEFIEWGERNWPKFSEAVSDMWAKVRPVFEAFRGYFSGWVKIIQGIIQGDWSLVWAGVKKVVVSGFKLVYEYLKAVPLNLFKLGIRMGKALADGVIAGIGNLVDRITDKIPGISDKGFQKEIEKAKAKVRARPSATTSGGTGGANFRGPRARGGPVAAGASYLVGERGPELLTMGRSSGFVSPSHGGGTLIVPVYLNGHEIARAVLPEFQRMAKHGASQQRGRYGGSNLALG